MNLHDVVSGAIAGIEPDTQIRIRQNNGYQTAPDGSRTPLYKTIDTTGQIQNTSARELQQLAGLGVEGDIAMVWLDGSFDGVVRADKKGGDLFTFRGKAWLAVQVMEQWDGWCRVAVCLQSEGC